MDSVAALHRSAAPAPRAAAPGPFASAGTLIAALAARELSAVEALDAAIERIERSDAAINAVVVRDLDAAREAARRADARLGRGEQAPLLGLPMTVKESFHVRGLATTWGLPHCRDRLAPSDSLVVQRLRRAGAVIVGKTNVCTALADWQCDNPVYGSTRNPWDTRRSPGGSSGGSAAALAAGLTPLELGSDVAGSIRVPAHHCGVFGHRPSAGLVPSQGCEMPTTRCASDLGAIGPLARCADDLARALHVLAGPAQPEAAAWRLALPAPGPTRLAEFRVLVLDAHPLVRTSDAVRAALQRLAGDLARRGVRVEHGSDGLPGLVPTAECFARTLAMQNLARLPSAQFDAELRAADDPPDAPLHGGAALLAQGRSAARGGLRDWFAAVETRAALARQWVGCFDRWDVIVCPTSTTTAPLHDPRPLAARRLDVDGGPASCLDQLAWVSIAPLAGLPATQVPLGLDAQGLPVGAQVMAAPFQDLTAIAFARHLEREFGGFVAPNVLF